MTDAKMKLATSVVDHLAMGGEALVYLSTQAVHVSGEAIVVGDVLEADDRQGDYRLAVEVASIVAVGLRKRGA